MKTLPLLFPLIPAAVLAQQKPNIIIILADDMGYSDLGCYGSEINTPNIDKLAANGIRFRQFYNCARSCPTRAALLTGLYPHKADMGWMTAADLGNEGYQGDLSKHSATIAQVLKPEGYENYMVGKWHVTSYKYESPDGPKHNWPLQRGFDRFFGTVKGGGNYYNPVTLCSGNTQYKKAPDGFYYTDALADSASKFISEQHDNKPFFMYLAFTAPHWPLHAKSQDIAKYKGIYGMGWDKLRELRHERMIKLGILKSAYELTPREARVPAWDSLSQDEKDLWALRMAIYAAQIDCMDQGIGRVIKTLKDKGILENTAIFFLSDNGACAEFISTASKDPGHLGDSLSFESYRINWANASSTPFREYKHWTHEGGIATPLIVHYPAGIKNTNSITDQIGHVTDLMATCIELSGAKYPKRLNGNTIRTLDGMSLVPAMTGQSYDRGYVFWEHESNRALRYGKWKLVSRGFTENGPLDWELYDMEQDRTELHNLANEHAELVKSLSEKWEGWAKANYVYPIDNREWGPRVNSSK